MGLGGLAHDRAYGLGRADVCLADEPVLRALELDQELNNKSGIASRYNNISAAYLELERFDDALFVSEDALFIADSIGALTQISDIHKQRTTIFERKGDYEGFRSSAARTRHRQSGL